MNPAEECGHIEVPRSVDHPRFSTNDGIRKAHLSCSKTGHVFAGEKNPTPQYCFKGRWTYQSENYEIPGCQGKTNNTL